MLLLMAATPGENAAQRRVQAADAVLAARREAVARLADQRVKAAADLRIIETGVIDASERLEAAKVRSAAADQALAERQADMEKILPIMMRLSRFPAETVLAVPLPPKQALEGLLITRGLSAQIEQEARALREQQASAARLRAAMDAERSRLAARRAAQQAAAAALDRQVAAARAAVDDAEKVARAAAMQAAAVAARAATLRGAVAATDATSTGMAEPGQGGVMIAPVAGKVVHAWGSPAEDGPATGITFAAAPGGFVVSPCGGRVAFAAPFRSYGRLLIIECGGGYDVVLAGLERLDAPVGRAVRAGEPVGRMPDYNPARTTGRPGLYMELRTAGLGQPQDPLPFLKARG